MDNSPLHKHDTRSWVMALILGIFIGLAVIVPGVSGSTIAIIFGLYTGMLYAMGNILTDFKRCVAFLIPIGIGVVVGFGAGFLVIQELFEKYLVELVCLFVGLMVGAVPALTAEIKGTHLTVGRGILFGLGFLIPLGVCAVSVLLGEGSGEEGATFTSFPPELILSYLPLGFLVAVTQIVPGLSATAILMAFGQFKPILNSLHLDYILANPTVILLYAALGIGFLVGLVSVSKLFSNILAKHKDTAFYMVIGLAFGSIASMFFNSDMVDTYTLWAETGNVPVLTLAIAAVLLAVGFIISYLLVRYELNHPKKDK